MSPDGTSECKSERTTNLRVFIKTDAPFDNITTPSELQEKSQQLVQKSRARKIKVELWAPNLELK